MDKFIKNLARGAGEILREGFRTKFKINHKTALWDIVTEYDLASEKFVMDKIRKKFPSHGIISEETSQIIKKNKNLWLIDPIDGTRAFSRGLAQFCVSIAYVSKNRIEYGVIYDPIAEEMFFAQRNKGAQLNGRKISVFPAEDLQTAILCTHLGTLSTSQKERRRIHNLIVKHRMWSLETAAAALSGAYVAAGRYDGIIFKNLSVWDTGAAALMLSEAGAAVTDYKGKPFRWHGAELVAANPVLHKKLLKELKRS